MNAVTLLADVLAEHRRFGGGCTCGRLPEDPFVSLADEHRAHVAAMLADALAEWLTSDETVEVASAASYEHPGPEGKTRWAWTDKRVWEDTRNVWRSDTHAALAAVAATMGGDDA